MKRALIVVATAAEAEFFGLGSWAEVRVSGVGPVSAALQTASALQTGAFDLAVSAGIGGGFVQNGVQVGEVVVADRMTHADLGAWSEDGFLSLEELNLAAIPGAESGPRFASFEAHGLVATLRQRTSAHGGEILTVSGATGSDRQANALLRRFPQASCEGMEGAGVAQAAFQFGVPALEIRGISNAVGKRDRAAWRIPAALQACWQALDVLGEILR